MQSRQLADLVTLAREAGDAIMAVYQGDFAVQTKGDASPLTEADLRAEAIIQAGLARLFPDVAVWSEEAAQPAARVERFFLVDPLDGTKEFVQRNGEFTVNIALIDHGRPVAGVVVAPALAQAFWAAEGEGAWGQEGSAPPRALKAAACPAEGALRVVGSRSHGSEATTQWLQNLGRPFEFVAVGSSLKICRVAEGQADLYPRLGPTSQWDIAAAHAILAVAGGAVVDLQGQELRYGLDREVLNPYFVAVADRRLLEFI
jgi:3'(2'), 5'-bisphosphate nucleotidase